jgi:outer membrane lipoprotein SlyB
MANPGRKPAVGTNYTQRTTQKQAKQSRGADVARVIGGTLGAGAAAAMQSNALMVPLTVAGAMAGGAIHSALNKRQNWTGK